MLTKAGGKGGLNLWPLFGATNQMLAALSLMVISVYLIRLKKPFLPFLIPAVLVTLITAVGILLNIQHFIKSQNYMLAILAGALFLIQILITGSGISAIKKSLN